MAGGISAMTRTEPIIQGQGDQFDEDDPFARAIRRESRSGAGIDVLVWDAGDAERAERIGVGLVRLIEAERRSARMRILCSNAEEGQGATLRKAIEETSAPLILITTAIEPWTAAHLSPVLESVDRADHVLGRRPIRGAALWKARLHKLARTLVYSTPILDTTTPCRLHRREAIAAIPLQSESCYLEFEMLAKATFLGHLVEETPIPGLEADENPRRRAMWAHDRADVWRRPIFRIEPAAMAAVGSGPAKETEGQEEGDEGPGGENEDAGPDGGDTRALDDDGAKGGGELGER